MNNKYKKIIIFTIFFFLVSIQIHFVWMYYDDYGYASLSYLAGYTGNIGLDTSIRDVFSFLLYHYQHWGGRVLWFFLEIILLKINIHAFRITEIFFITLIFFMINQIVSKITKIDNMKLSIATILCFGLIDLMVIRDSFYWFTASVLYLFPILPILIIVYLTLTPKETNTIGKIIAIFLAFIAAWSQEQISIYIVAYLFFITCHRFIIEKKSDNKWHIAMLTSAIIGFLILMLAPGSKERMMFDTGFYSLSLISKIRRNIPIIIGSNFSTETRIFSIIFFVTNTYLLITNRKKFKKKKMIDLGLLNSILILLTTIINEKGYFNVLYDINHFKTLIIILTTIQFGYILFLEFLVLYDKKKYHLAFLFLASILSQAAMIMAPYFPLRSTTIFEITIYIIAIYLFANIIKTKKFNSLNYHNINVYLILKIIYMINKNLR